MDSIPQSSLFQKHRDLVAVRRRPVIQLNHIPGCALAYRFIVAVTSDAGLTSAPFQSQKRAVARGSR
jgi:hypothetical protein